MEERIRKKQYIRSITYKYFIYIVAVIAIIQLLTLRACYTEKVLELPERLFSSAVDFPISGLTLDITSGEAEPEITGDGETAVTEEIPEEEAEESETDEMGIQNLTDTQKSIILKALEMLDRDIEYGYQLYPDTGYPSGNVWISTDVISMTYNECEIDLLELIYQDMVEHKEDYPMDKTGRKTPIKHIDSRDVIFQAQFFNRNATTLTTDYNINNEDNSLLWQAGDIVYFRFDENNIDKDRGGFISPHINDSGVNLVIMISPENNTLEEADVLQEYEIVGHYRYPPVEVN